MLTVFANIRVNSRGRLEHLKDSFASFEGASDDWLINIRGAYREEAIAFLKGRLGNKGNYFELLDDSRGWICNALDMLPHARHPYLLVWNEDHLNIAPQELLTHVVAEMRERGVHYLLYSWWQKGRARTAFETLALGHGTTIDTVELTAERWRDVIGVGHPYYMLSLCGVFEKNFFDRLLRRDQHKLPYVWTKNVYRVLAMLQRLGVRFDQKEWFHRINRLFRFRFRRFPKDTPFDLEKARDRFDMLPFKLGLSKQELFACIDDDNNIYDRGSSLVARGLYPIRDVMRVSGEDIGNPNMGERMTLAAGETYRARYYQDANRQEILREKIVVDSGRVDFSVGARHVKIGPGMSVSFCTNVMHEIKALEKASLRRIVPTVGPFIDGMER